MKNIFYFTLSIIYTFLMCGFLVICNLYLLKVGIEWDWLPIVFCTIAIFLLKIFKVERLVNAFAMVLLLKFCERSKMLLSQGLNILSIIVCGIGNLILLWSAPILEYSGKEIFILIMLSISIISSYLRMYLVLAGTPINYNSAFNQY